MDIKKKLLNLKEIVDRKTGPKPPDLEDNFDAPSPSSVTLGFVSIPRDVPNDPIAEQECIDSIDVAYYSPGTQDLGLYELNKLTELLELQDIDSDRKRLRRQLQVVSKKVSELILEKQTSCARELQRVQELMVSLQDAKVVCADGRSNLSFAKSEFTTASLSILASFRHKQQLLSLLTSLVTIKTLHQTDVRLRELLDEGDYPGAIQLCLECQKAASTYRHYKCISELSSKLADTMVLLEESLDQVLAQTCLSFIEDRYGRVQAAYQLLGKTQTATDQLLMHYASAVHNTAFSVVLAYLEDDGMVQKRQYADLCRTVRSSQFLSCLADLCKALYNIMRSYYSTARWHENHEMDEKGGHSENVLHEDVEATLNRRYIKQKLQHGLTRIYQDVQQKVKVYFQSIDLAFFNFDEFMQSVYVVNKMVAIGAEFCGSASEQLEEVIRLQCRNYFLSFHKSRLDELHMFLENEGWELCPVRSSFATEKLHEFRFLRSSLREDAKEKDKEEIRYFHGRISRSCNPFQLENEDEEKEDVLATGIDSDGAETDSDSDDEPAELKQAFIEDGQPQTTPVKKVKKQSLTNFMYKSSKQMPPLLANTTLNVLRLFGKYTYMMNLLKTIAFEVSMSMSQLFDFYLYSVYVFFANPASVARDDILSNKLKWTLKRITCNIIVEEVEDEMDGEISGVREEGNFARVPKPHLSPSVNLSDPHTLFGLAERVAATESLVFLAEQFQMLRPHIEKAIPESKRPFVQQFYSQTVNLSADIRIPIYRSVVEYAIDFQKTLQVMTEDVRWDVDEIMSQHSQYVDMMLAELHSFSLRLNQVAKHIPIPIETYNAIWTQCVYLCNRTFVEGYSSVKKCSNEGRALMQLDYQQFLSKLEQLTKLRGFPDREFVEAYIKAYYAPENVLEQWVKDHKEYTPKQRISLINSMSHISKKCRNRLVGMIEENERGGMSTSHSTSAKLTNFLKDIKSEIELKSESLKAASSSQHHQRQQSM